MDKHTQDCIRFFELMAASREREAEDYETRHKEARINDPLYDYYFYEGMKEKAVARAYRTCIEALANPAYFQPTTEG